MNSKLLRKRKPRRRPGWSYGGIEILNALESKSSAPVVTAHLSHMKMLKLLLLKCPNNPFYKGLKQHSETKALSRKQLICIEENYTKLFSHN